MRIVCVSCPVGCAIEVEVADGRPVRIQGHACPRGEAYAREEVLDPQRVLTTSVGVTGGDLPLASVRTTRPIPRRLIPRALAHLRSLTPAAPLAVGQVLVEDLLGTGAAVVVTRAVAARPGADGGPGSAPTAGAGNAAPPPPKTALAPNRWPPLGARWGAAPDGGDARYTRPGFEQG